MKLYWIRILKNYKIFFYIQSGLLNDIYKFCGIQLKFLNKDNKI